MTDFIFQSPEMAWFFPLIAIFVLLFIQRKFLRNKDLRNFSNTLVSKSGKWRSLILCRFSLLCIAVVFMILALMRPAWDLHPKLLKKEGRDLVFLLDVSNSMRAEDLLPNRLERCKIAIQECVDSLEQHRIGLVVFAGSASIKCPLTLDYEFFSSMLQKIDSDSVQYDEPKPLFLNTAQTLEPDNVHHGGTRLEDAILKTCDKLFSDSKRGYKDIILISDGGDQGKSLDKALEAINNTGARLIAIGVGDETSGARIPNIDKHGFMLYEGREVWTKLESRALTFLVDNSEKAVYLPAGTKQMDLAQIYKQLSTQKGVQELGENSVMVYTEKYHLFLYVSLTALIIMILTPATIQRAAKSSIILFIILCSPNLKADEVVTKKAHTEVKAHTEEDTHTEVKAQTEEDTHTEVKAQDDEDSPKQGITEDFFEKMADKVLQHLERLIVQEETPEISEELQKLMEVVANTPSMENCFELARKLIAQGNFQDAANAYSQALTGATTREDLARATYNMANCYYQQSGQSEEKEEALELIRDSKRLYRKVLRELPSFKEAAINFEVCKINIFKIHQEIAEEDKLNQEIEKFLEEARKQLEALIASQDNIVKQDLEHAENTTDKTPLVTEEQTVLADTHKTISHFETFKNKHFSGPQADMFPFQASLGFILGAMVQEEESIKLLKANAATSHEPLKKALDGLIEAREALEQEQQSSDSSSDEEGEESDDEGEEGDEEGEEEGEQEGQASAGKIDLNSQDIPPPNESPQDILKMEQQLQELRKANKKSGKRSGVKKDW